MSALWVAVNGEPREIASGTTLLALVDAVARDRSRIAVERNRAIAPRAEWASIEVADGDEIEIVTLVGGG